MNYSITRENELYHHGVKGMHWGVRRYQNADGSLTAEGRKRYLNADGSLNEAGKKMISDQYKKHTIRAQDAVETTSNYVKAYNRAADKVNKGLTDKYNRDYDKKLGDKAKNHDYMNDIDYIEGYEKMFDDIFVKEYKDLTFSEYSSNIDFQKAEKLLEMYGMNSWDDLAKENYKIINEYRKSQR